MPPSRTARCATPRVETALVSHAYPSYIHQITASMSTTCPSELQESSWVSTAVSWVTVKTKTRSKNSSSVDTRSTGCGLGSSPLATLGEATLRCVPRREISSWLMDMDGVLVREENAIPGADRFLARLRELGLPFLVLTNNSIYTRRDLAARLANSGLHVPEEAIWTSALATGRFLETQRPGGSAFVIGEAGLTTALHEAGYTLTERDPDYVVL